MSDTPIPFKSKKMPEPAATMTLAQHILDANPHPHVTVTDDVTPAKQLDALSSSVANHVAERYVEGGVITDAKGCPHKDNSGQPLFAIREHAHSEYAARNHTHSDYAAQTDVDLLTNRVDVLENTEVSLSYTDVPLDDNPNKLYDRKLDLNNITIDGHYVLRTQVYDQYANDTDPAVESVVPIINGPSAYTLPAILKVMTRRVAYKSDATTETDAHYSFYCYQLLYTEDGKVYMRKGEASAAQIEDVNAGQVDEDTGEPLLPHYVATGYTFPVNSESQSIWTLISPIVVTP